MAYEILWGEGAITHLLRKTTFGPSEKMRKMLSKANNHSEAVDILVSNAVKKSKKGILKASKRDYTSQIRAKYVQALLKKEVPLLDRLTMWWNDQHFSIQSSATNATFYANYVNLLRQFGFGKFKTMVKEIAKCPAMVAHLDSNSNLKQKPNENFVRELHELFTVGVDNGYEQEDIVEGARAFTGWYYNTKKKKFYLRPEYHDFSNKTFWGKRGPWDGTDVIDILFTGKNSARNNLTFIALFITEKLLKLLLEETPSEDDILFFADKFEKSDFDFAVLVSEILKSEKFWLKSQIQNRVKSPTDFAIGLWRSLNIKYKDSIYTLNDFFDGMGENHFEPPRVEGYDGGPAWMGATPLFQRIYFSSWTMDRPVKKTKWQKTTFNPLKLKAVVNGGKDRKTTSSTLTSGTEVINRVAALLNVELSDTTKTALETYMNLLPGGGAANYPLEADTLSQKIRGCIQLIAASPEYQLV